MRTFEYTAVFFDAQAPEDETPSEEAIDALNEEIGKTMFYLTKEYGAKGWELVSVTREGLSFHAFLKRELSIQTALDNKHPS